MAKSLVQLLAEKGDKPKASPKTQRSTPSSSSSSNKAPDGGSSKERLYAIYGKPKKTIKKTLKRPPAASRRSDNKHEVPVEGKSCEDAQLM